MKSAVLLSLAVTLCALPAFAQNRIEFYGDESMHTCAIIEPISPPIVQVHVFLTGPVSATGARFTARKPDCWVGATWLGDALGDRMFSIGNSQGDWSLAWSIGSHCETSHAPPIHIGFISYQISQQAQACCKVEALHSGIAFEFYDCQFATYELEESRPIMVNPGEGCGCQSGVTTAVETTSWGRVKALYR